MFIFVTNFKLQQGKIETVNFLRLNINDNYSYGMGLVDISNQLRNYYCFDHWMWKRKWWWLIFFWGLGVSLVNTYVLYKKLMEENGRRPLSQYEFCRSILLAWLDSDTYWPIDMRNSTKNVRKLPHPAAFYQLLAVAIALRKPKQLGLHL